MDSGQISITVYIEPTQISGFKVWAIRQGVRLKQPDEIQVVNSIDVSETLFVAQQMVGTGANIVTILKGAIALGKRILAFNQNTCESYEVKTDKEISHAVEFKFDLKFVSASSQFKAVTKTKSKRLRKSKPKSK